MPGPFAAVRSTRALRPTSGRSQPFNSQRYWFFIHYLGKVESKSDPAFENNSEGLEAIPKIRRLEAALFLSREGLSSRKLAKLAGLADATEARTLIRQINQTYDEQGRSFRVEEIAGGYVLLTRPQFATWLRRVAHVPHENRLSQSMMETLAIVAYRQPVLRVEVEAIRGVGSSEVLKQLMELDLVRISGRSEDLGRPYLYGTTRRFLQMFGLRSTDRLPRKEWVNELQMALSSPEIAASDSDVKESQVNHGFTATSVLEEELTESTIPAEDQPVTSSIEDDDDEFFEESDDEWDDDDDDDEDDFDDDDEDNWDDDDEEEDDDLEEENEWEEVDDDDDGWSEDDDEDDDDDDWSEDDDDDDEDWD